MSENAGHSDWSDFKRQPFSAVWQILFKTVVQLLKSLWPFLLVILIRSDSDRVFSGNLVLYFFSAIALGKALAEYYFYQFRINADEVQVRYGIFSRKQTIIPLHKIQTVHASQTWIQKILKLTELAFDTPGSEKAEITFQVSQEDADELMKQVLSKRTVTEESEKNEDQISRLSFRDLLFLGLTANHLNTLLILVGLFLSFLNNIRDIITEQYEDLLESSTNQLMSGSLLFIGAVIISLLLFSVLVSLVKTIINFANFRVTRDTHGFAISKGLINTSQKLIPYKKIQYLSWKTNWVRKKFPLYIFEFHTIGGAEVKSALKIRVPACSESTLAELSYNYSEGQKEEFENQVYLDPSYQYRNTFFFGLIPTIILAVPAVIFAPEKAIFLIILTIYAGLYFWLFRKKYVFTYNEELIHIKTGVFGYRTILLKWKKIQSAKIIQTLFQQRKDLATLVLYTAGGTISVPYIPLATAREIQNFALFKIESSTDLWE